jgi:hypothetical protein
LAKLRIDWKSRDSVAPKGVVTGQSGEETQKAAAAMRAERPMLIYITSDDPENSDVRKLESVVFASESVAVGTKFFDCYKITAGSALQDRILKEAGRYTPRLVLLDRDFNVEKVLQRSGISGGKLIRAMKGVARKEYVNRFDTMVRDYIKLLNELDRLEGKKAKIADDRARLADKPNASKARRVDRDEKEYKAEMEEWAKKEAELLELRRKDEPKPDA